jgi:putative restriction endonuclease
MKGFVGITDNQWYEFLSQQPGIDEVNFWQPGGSRIFRSLKAGAPFFFKLHSPENFIVGVAFFAHSTILPISIAWSAFGIKNGASSLSEMRRRTEKYRRSKPSPLEDYKIGCIVLSQPLFFEREDWISVPPDFNLNIVQGKTYDLTSGHGFRLWEQIEARLQTMPEIGGQLRVAEAETRYGLSTLVRPRLGQGSFRVLVTDVYERRCAVTREKTLPALEAAHIKPFSEDGPNRVDNGLLLRSDIHRLFDSGYVTVTSDHHFEVSNRIKEEFDNGEEYRALHGKQIWIPPSSMLRPSPNFLTWHNDRVFRR